MVVLIFAIPLFIAAMMISPTGMSVWGVSLLIGLVLVASPVLAWPSFLIQGIFPPGGQSRVMAILSLWLGGALVLTGLACFIVEAGDYRPTTSVDASAHWLVPYSPQAGLRLGLFVICMLVSSGFWGAFARILPPAVAMGGAVVTGCMLFLMIAMV